jgi:seryl-tRNA synthetase
MLDLREVRRNLQAVAEALAVRGYIFDTAAFEELDARRKRADVLSQELQAERKRASKRIGELVGQGVPVEDAKQQVEEQLADIGARIDSAEVEARAAQAEMDRFMQGVPNIPHPDVPPGSDEDDNRVIAHWGELPQFDFEPRDHVDIGAGLGGLDSELGGKITGSRFTVLSGGVARLHRALIQFMLNCTPPSTPAPKSMCPTSSTAIRLRGTGQLPKFAEDLFKLEGDQQYYLIPTAEVPVTNIARERIFEAAELGERGIVLPATAPAFAARPGVMVVIPAA